MVLHWKLPVRLGLLGLQLVASAEVPTMMSIHCLHLEAQEVSLVGHLHGPMSLLVSCPCDADSASALDWGCNLHVPCLWSVGVTSVSDGCPQVPVAFSGSDATGRRLDCHRLCLPQLRTICRHNDGSIMHASHS